MDNNFARVKSIIQRMRDVLKCQKCLQLKEEDSMIFYHLCDHFYCVDCFGDGKSCQLCRNPFDKSTKVVNDKNVLSLYQSLINFELPSKQDADRIYKNHKKSKEIREQDHKNPKEIGEEEIKETPKNSTRGRGTLNVKSGNVGRSNGRSGEEVTLKGRRIGAVEDEDVMLVERGTPKTTHVKGGRNVTPAGRNITPVAMSTGRNKANTSASKVNINKRNPKGETQLHIACKKSNFTAMEALIAAGASPNARDNAGWTPLHDSVFSGNVEVIKFLLHHGAKVNTPGLENTTALHEAIAKGNEKIVRLLLEYGADAKAMNIFRETPLDLVNKYKMEEMKKILLEASSDNRKAGSEVEVEESEQNIVIYKHNLGVDDEKSVNKFVEKFNIDVVSSVTLKTPPTHIIVANEKFDVTWAVISSVPAGCWIVTVDWVKVSLEENNLKPAARYEPSKPFFSGFPKARANKQHQLPGLFSGCHFFFGGHFTHYNVKNVTIGKEELKLLVEKLGGTTLKRCPDPESLALEKTIPYHATPDSSLRETSYFIVYQSDKWDPKPKYNMSHIKTLPVDWLICCLFKFELVDPKEKDPPFCDFL